MEISDVRVRLVKDTNDRLKAVCSVTLGEQFVVRDVKVVEGTNGLFVAMPSRKLSAACPKCRTQNHLRARHCNECGGRLSNMRIPTDADGREKVHRDIAHPITSSFRQEIQQRVLDAFQAEFEQQMDEESVETVEEPAEEQSETQYDSLIANLGGGQPREEEQVSNRDGGDSSQEGEGGRRRRRRRGPRDRDRRPEPVATPENREPATANSFGEDAEEPDPVEPAGFEPEAEDQPESTGFGPGSEDQRPAPVEDEYDAESDADADEDTAVLPAVPGDEPGDAAPDRNPAAIPDDDAPFGAGIL